VHRDVKPGNILLDENHALLADFGIARAITQLSGNALSDSGMVIGTPEYMSPEQCSDKGKLDGRSDIYALGCVLYQMLSGEPPFTGPTAQSVIARHLQERPRSLRVVRSSVPEHVEEAVQVALAKVPADRFTGPLQFVAALTPEGETAPAIRRARAARRRRTRVTAAILATLGTALILGFWKFPSSGHSAGARAGAGAAPALSNIAVLYLQDRSEHGRLGYLAAGLTEDLIDRLAAVKALRVVSPDGVRPYRDKDVPLDSLVRAFRVGTIVTGSLSGVPRKLRASIRLTDAANGMQLFSGTFEKPLGNVLELRDQLADEVVRQLRMRLGEAVQLQQRRAETTNDAAWELVRRTEQLRDQARGLSVGDSGTSKRVYRDADSLLAQAERLDPAWTEPTVLRGWLAFDQADLAAGADTAGAPGRTLAADWIKRGILQAERALRKAPGQAEALELRGSLRFEGWKLTGFSGPQDTVMQLDKAERDLRDS
jgi:TolB-like protein